MCTTCGCGSGDVKIDGERAGHAHHEHDHVHADGTAHSHAHDHAAGEAHQHPRAHAHEHSHSHSYAPADGHDHPRAHAYAPAHAHAPGISGRRMVQIEQDILAKNNSYAAQNRRYLTDRGVFALNLVSSPGSGKTTLLVKSIELLKGGRHVAVIEGDQQTSQDAERIRATGAPAIQINTGKGCHLDAHMVGHAIEKLDLPDDSLLMIENVGNLVCPAAFDLGEAHKVVILSVTEGEDKPIKYPDMFRAATLMLMNKCDLLPHLSFSVARAVDYARRVNPAIEVIEVSATTGEGIEAWLRWIEDGAREARARRQDTIDSLKRRVAQLEGQLAARSA